MDWKHGSSGTIGTGFGIGLAMLDLSSITVPAWFIYCGYAVATALIVYGVSPWVGVRWQSPVYREQKDGVEVKSGAIIQPPLIKTQEILCKKGIDFFPTIDALRAAHPLHETFKVGNDIHALFLTGEGVFAEHSEYMKCVKRLVLPEPNDNNLLRLKDINQDIPYKSQIMTYANKMREQNPRAMRFAKDFLGMSLLFCNPERPNGWVQIGLILPEIESAHRVHFRLFRTEQEAGFLNFYKTFEGVWAISEEKTEEEYLEEGFQEG